MRLLLARIALPMSACHIAAVPGPLQWYLAGKSYTAWAASTLCWLFVLRVAPLSRAYALTSVTYVLVPLVSVYLFGEQLRRVHVVGMILIVLGITCVLSGK